MVLAGWQGRDGSRGGTLNEKAGLSLAVLPECLKVGSGQALHFPSWFAVAFYPQLLSAGFCAALKILCVSFTIFLNSP